MKLKNIIIAVLCITALSSCNDWFDVTSSNEIKEKDQFSTDQGFAQVAAGCYMKMGTDDMYGKYASYGIPEVSVNPYASLGLDDNYFCYLQRHEWEQAQTRNIVDNLWASFYSNIVNANEALLNIDAKEKQMDPINYHVIKGELLGIRALMHFDLLRYYGYGNWANRKSELDAKLTIPYVTTVEKNVTPQATGSEVINDILTDLTAAADLLKDYDPVCGTHDDSYYEEVDEDGFYDSRNFHMNYYAVLATMAQVYQWIGDYDNALKYAKTVIDEIGSGKTVTIGTTTAFTLRLMNPSEINQQTAALTYEAVFAVETQELSSKTNYIFYPGYTANDNNKTLKIDETTAQNLYNNSNTDVRFTTLMFHNQSGEPNGYVPLKYYEGFGVNSYFANNINVIRLPEVYFIAAEAYARNGDVSNALSLINTVREARGLYTPLADLTADQTLDELALEYQREFMGEGIMYFYYKRLGAASVPAKDGEMTDDDYVLPYPDVETQAGRVQ